MCLRFLATLFSAAIPVLAAAQPLGLPEVIVYSPRVALQEPVNTFAMPVSALRFEPLVDVQGRNMAEGQADIAIRGGIFENSGFRVGALPLYDPQTGHYFAEIPISPAMLGAPALMTGAENALRGWNANAGTVAYGWRPIRSGGAVSASVGDYDTRRADVYAGRLSDRRVGGRRIAADGAFSHSRSDGSRRFGEHEFTRYNARIQLADESAQTNLFYGYQSKFFGWPNLYTPFANVFETENIQTNLVTLSHRAEFGGGDFVQAGAYYRRNKDNYVFNRAEPGAFNPAFATSPAWHTTWVYGAGYEARFTEGDLRWNLLGTIVDDELASTSLTFGRYRTRRHWKLAVAPEREWGCPSGAVVSAKVGIAIDDTTRDESAISPLAEIALRPAGKPAGIESVYASYSEATQTTTYFALNSRPNAGLFRGNPDLRRQVAHNFEVGARAIRGGWSGNVAVFHRKDERLVDWTYASALPNARAANAVDIDTTGVEAVFRFATQRLDLLLGYTGLSKSEDYGDAPVDASFYALNYPEHRLTAAVTVKLGAGIEVRMDNEARIQRENALRRSANEALLSSLGVFYSPSFLRGVTVAVTVENLWDSDFQEVPAVPAARRQFSVGAAVVW